MNANSQQGASTTDAPPIKRTGIAGENIPSNVGVYRSSSDRRLYRIKSTDDMRQYVGVSLSYTPKNNSLTCIWVGNLRLNSDSLQSNKPVYIGSNGKLTNNVSGADWIHVGDSKDSKNIQLAGASGNTPIVTTQIITNTMKIYDTDKSNTLELKWNENDSVDRILNLKVGASSRTLDMDGDLTVEADSRINQDVTDNSATVEFRSLTIRGDSDPFLNFFGNTTVDVAGSMAIETLTINDDLDLTAGQDLNLYGNTDASLTGHSTLTLASEVNHVWINGKDSVIITSNSGNQALNINTEIDALINLNMNSNDVTGIGALVATSISDGTITITGGAISTSGSYVNFSDDILFTGSPSHTIRMEDTGGTGRIVFELSTYSTTKDKITYGGSSIESLVFAMSNSAEAIKIQDSNITCALDVHLANKNLVIDTSDKGVYSGAGRRLDIINDGASNSFKINDDSGGDTWFHINTGTNYVNFPTGTVVVSNTMQATTFTDNTITITGGAISTSGSYVNFSDSVNVSTASSPTVRITNTTNGGWTPGDVLGALEFYTDDTSGSYPGATGAIKSSVADIYGTSWCLDFYYGGTGGLTKGFHISDVGVFTNSIGAATGIDLNAGFLRNGVIELNQEQRIYLNSDTTKNTFIQGDTDDRIEFHVLGSLVFEVDNVNETLFTTGLRTIEGKKYIMNADDGSDTYMWSTGGAFNLLSQGVNIITSTGAATTFTGTTFTDGTAILTAGAFTTVVGGVTPTADAHLATKGYVDNVASGGLVTTTRVTTTYTILEADHFIVCDSDGGDFTVTLPAGVDGTVYVIKNAGTSGNTLTVDGNGAETIDFELTQDLDDGDCIQLIYEDTEKWSIV